MSATDDPAASTTAPPPAPGSAGGARATGERADLLEALRTHRALLRQTPDGITDEQAGLRTTASSLCLGGLVEHVAATEDQWARSVLEGPSVMGGDDAAGQQQRDDDVAMLPGETVEGVLAGCAAVAARTDALVVDLPDLDASQELPPAPWFEPGGRRSARRVLVHGVGETAQHAGHADIIRESLDGARTTA